ncbi:MAG: hypothetical protein CME65_06405 [Halobacteriovoraceae bacterium]|nr:hypothetical protein [Halobacteriovoraceae bacterium]
MKFLLLLFLSFQVSAKDFKVLTWNIFMLPTWAKKVKQNERLGPIAEHLAQTDYDFIMLQEVFTKKSFREISKALEENYPYNTGKPFRKWYRITNSGLVIFSKYPLDNTKIYLYYCMAHADRFSSKGFLISTATLPDGSKIQVGTTHLQARTGEKYEKIRSRQLRKIEKEILGKEKNPSYPFIVGGDFNIDWYQSNQADEFLSRMSALPIEFAVPKGELIYSSDYANNDLIQYLKPERTSQKFIDYIFAYPGENLGTSIKEIKVLDIEGTYVLRKRPGKHNLSDHHAVEAIISID